MKRLGLLPCLLPLLAHAAVGPQPYACDDGSQLAISFSADFSGRPSATLHRPDGDLVLPAVPAATGALYRAGEVKLHARGNDLLFTDGQGGQRHCTPGERPPGAVISAAASSLIGITGQVGYPARIALPPNALLTIQVRDTARRPALTLVEQRYELNGAQAPIPFSAAVDRDLIGSKAQLTVFARIEAGRRLLFAGNAALPANGVPVDIRLQPANPARR